MRTSVRGIHHEPFNNCLNHVMTNECQAYIDGQVNTSRESIQNMCSRKVWPHATCGVKIRIYHQIAKGSKKRRFSNNAVTKNPETLIIINPEV